MKGYRIRFSTTWKKLKSGQLSKISDMQIPIMVMDGREDSDTMADSVLACPTMAGDGEVLSYSVNTGVLVVDSMEEADSTVVGEGNSVWRIIHFAYDPPGCLTKKKPCCFTVRLFLCSG